MSHLLRRTKRTAQTSTLRELVGRQGRNHFVPREVCSGSFATETTQPGCHPMSAILPIATEIARRCNISRWARQYECKGRRLAPLIEISLLEWMFGILSKVRYGFSRTIKALQIHEIVRDLPDRKDERERICGIVKDDHRRQQVDRMLNRRRRFTMSSDGRLRGRQPWTMRQGCPGPRSNMAPRVPNGSGVTPRTQSSMRSASS